MPSSSPATATMTMTSQPWPLPRCGPTLAAAAILALRPGKTQSLADVETSGAAIAMATSRWWPMDHHPSTGGAAKSAAWRKGPERRRGLPRWTRARRCRTPEGKNQSEGQDRDIGLWVNRKGSKEAKRLLPRTGIERFTKRLRWSRRVCGRRQIAGKLGLVYQAGSCWRRAGSRRRCRPPSGGMLFFTTSPATTGATEAGQIRTEAPDPAGLRPSDAMTTIGAGRQRL